MADRPFRTPLLAVLALLASTLVAVTAVSHPAEAAPAIFPQPPSCIPAASTSTDNSHQTGGEPFTYCWSSSDDGLAASASGTIGRGSTATVTAQGDFSSFPNGDTERIRYQRSFDTFDACAIRDATTPGGWLAISCPNAFDGGQAVLLSFESECEEVPQCDLGAGTRMESDNVWIFVDVSARLGDAQSETLRDVTVTVPIRLEPYAAGSRPLAIADVTLDGQTIQLDGTRSQTRVGGPSLVSHEWQLFVDGGDAAIAETSGPVGEFQIQQGEEYRVELRVTDAEGGTDVDFEYPEARAAELTVEMDLPDHPSGVVALEEAADGGFAPQEVTVRIVVRNDEATTFTGVTLPESLAITRIDTEGADPNDPPPVTHGQGPLVGASLDTATPGTQLGDLAPGQTATGLFTVDVAGPSLHSLASTITSAEGIGTGRTDLIVTGGAPFTWEVRPRLEAPADGVLPDLPDEPDEVQHADYPVDFTITDPTQCTQPIQWQINGSPAQATETSPCVWTLRFPDEGERDIDLLVDGELVHRETVDVVDHLIVILGDSVASGEGNPDVPIGPDNPELGLVGQFADQPCHRSLRSGHAQAALRLEESDPHSSVTLVHLACSGATIDEGLLGAQDLSFTTVDAPAQVPLARELLGTRTADEIMLSIGGNDVFFGPVTFFCASHGGYESDGVTDFNTDDDTYVPCYQLSMSTTTDLNVSVVPGGQVGGLPELPIPEQLDASETSLCARVDPGATSVVVSDGGEANEHVDVTLNAEEVDFSERFPVGPTDSAEHEVTGRYAGTTCNRDLPGYLIATRTPAAPAVPFPHGHRLPLSPAVEEVHRVGYTPTLDGEDAPLAEVVEITPRYTLEQLMARALIPGLLTDLNTLRTQISGLVDDPEDINVVEYYDPLLDEGGEVCSNVLDSDITSGDDDGIDAAEARWARGAVLGELNRTLARTEPGFGWTFVGGPAGDFAGHGLCATDSWVHTLGTSAANGSLHFGTLHPNLLGHASMADTIYAAVVDDEVRAATVLPDPPPLNADTELSEDVEAGDDTVSVNDQSEFEVGDVVAIGADGTDTEVREVTALGSLVLDEPLANDHPAGARVVRLTLWDERPTRDDVPDAGVELTFGARIPVYDDNDVAMQTAIGLSQLRFPDEGDRRATHVVLARVDAFADALAGSALTGDAPLLLTERHSLDAGVAAEINRLLPGGGLVYVLGGEAALSATVAEALRDADHSVLRLAGETRVETAIAVADIVAETAPDGSISQVAIARATAPASNPTAGWADSVTGGAWSADTGTPILLSPGGSLHPAVAAWLAERGITSSVVLGGPAALGDAVVGSLPGPTRVFGEGREDTAAAIAEQLWGAVEGYLLIDGFTEGAWAIGLPAAGYAADLDWPLLMSRTTSVPDATAALLAGCPPHLTVGQPVGPESCPPLEELPQPSS